TGFDFYNLSQDATRFISRRSNGRLLFTDNAWPDASINNQGAYFQATRSFDAGEVSGGVRVDFIQADADRPSQFFLANTAGDVEQNEVNTSFNLAGRRRLLPGLVLAGGFGRAVRTANALERYSDRFPSTKFQVAAEFVGAPAAKPETSYQGDVALEYTVANLTLHGGTFYRRIDNFITVAPDPDLRKRLPLSPPVVFRYVSGDHANYRGFDFGLRYRFLPGWELTSQGSYTLGDDIQAGMPGVGRNEPLIGIPPFEVSTKLRYAAAGDRVWGEFGMRNAWGQTRVAASRLETPTPGFSTFSARAGAELPMQFTLVVGFENLGDKFYYEHLNSLNPFARQRIPERGRSVFFSLNKVF
ncbi:MAG: TonB-dependent receptor, partial [bacterium]|nr:TonB-dependent receptor [bacterium]